MALAEILPSPNEWKPHKAEWAFQKNVLSLLIELLENPSAKLRLIAEVIDSAQISKESTYHVTQQLQKMIKYRFGTKFDTGGREALLEDIRKQKAWIESLPGGVVPAELWRDQAARKEYERRGGR